MRYNVDLEQNLDGVFVASCADPACTASGLSPDEALESLTAEIRYQLEICPCTTPTVDTVELEVIPK